MQNMPKYHHYFDIDEEYFPQVNEAIIKNNPEIWKKYYPHEAFVKLIKDTVRVLSGQQKLSIWVEGAYGTGKSHAVLTLKKLLDCSIEDARKYFEDNPDELSENLCNKFLEIKNDTKKIITVHRYGSSSIIDDNSLVFALQESIETALEANGIENAGRSSLKNSVLNFISDDLYKDFFNKLITTKYRDLFGGDDVDAIIQKLNTFSGEPLLTLISNIMKVGKEIGFKPLSLDVNGLVNWIKNVIAENDLKAIIFIWDEFTEYFQNNLRSLTGFQQIVEISATAPFYLMIVTHKSEGLFEDTDKDKKKILDRFINPVCTITLPENMAFRLMGKAMKIKDDVVIQNEWQEIRNNLYDRTTECRALVKQKAKINDNELKGVLPIHPYAALLLKYISSAFDSNQRSMFDFIKNDQGDDIKAFQWFINHCNPYDNPFLTIDMLWDFFYEKGKEHLSSNIRAILDCYARAVTRNLLEEEKRVLKTVLLLQSVSQRVGNQVPLFIPNEKNINNAFEGSDLDIGAASRIAEKLCREEILYKKPISNNQFEFSALVNVGDTEAIEKIKQEISKKTTNDLIKEGNFEEMIALTGALKLRYEIHTTTHTKFNDDIKRIRNKSTNGMEKINAVIAFAKNNEESATISKLIDTAIEDGKYSMIFIDASTTTLNRDVWEQYVNNKTNAQYQNGKDNTLAKQYQNNAEDALKKWAKAISDGKFYISYIDEKGSAVKEDVVTVEKLYDVLTQINKRIYPCGLETGQSVIDNMWASTSLKSGVECGVEQVLKGTFKSNNPKTNLANYLQYGWQQQGEQPYWESKPNWNISKAKLAIQKVMEHAFEKDGRVSIAEIYDVVKEKPFGFMPCNLTAFVMGFLLKEYANNIYTYSDGLKSEALTTEKLKDMLDEVIKLQITQIKYKDKYIVFLTKEEKAFHEASSSIFGIPLEQCISVEQTRERIRNMMKNFSFPIWCIKYATKNNSLYTDVNIIHDLIDKYSAIANNNEKISYQSDADIALSIGKLCMQYTNLVSDLQTICNDSKCIEGMENYLHEFEYGELITLANAINDNGQYINALKQKFNVDAAKWLWNQETAQQSIKELILEYKIIAESNKWNTRTIEFKNTLTEWCNKCNLIRISYDCVKEYMNDMAPLLDILYSIKKSNGVITESQKQPFLDALKVYAEEFKYFYENQIDVFKKICDYCVSDFDDDEVIELYRTLPMNCFSYEKSKYIALVEEKVSEFQSQLESAKLKQLWKENTDTNTPKEWSKKYKMPILCMMNDEEVQNAKFAFDILNRQKADSTAVKKAISFLNSASFFDRLKDPQQRDFSFCKVILDRYSVILTDIDNVKEYLVNTIHCELYDWFGLPEVSKKLEQLAKQEYTQKGCYKALETIDNMDIADVKTYLKALIKDNMNVGIEIIKRNR